MARRTGIPSISDAAHELCRLLSKYAKVIVLLYPDNDELTLAMVAAQTACAALEIEVELVRDYGD